MPTSGTDLFHLSADPTNRLGWHNNTPVCLLRSVGKTGSFYVFDVAESRRYGRIIMYKDSPWYRLYRAKGVKFLRLDLGVLQVLKRMGVVPWTTYLG